MGVWDMAGNVWEWVMDEFSTYPVTIENETGSASSAEVYIPRGGSWGYTPAFVRTVSRYPVASEADYLAVGFRSAGD